MYSHPYGNGGYGIFYFFESSVNLENTLLQSNVAVTKGKEPLLVLQWVVGLFKCKQYEQIYEQTQNLETF